jgi:hypothetical protein
MLVPVGLWAAGLSFAFPDHLYEAHLAHRGIVMRLQDRVGRRILGISGAGLACDVVCHRLLEVCQPKAVMSLFSVLLRAPWWTPTSGYEATPCGASR